MSLDPYEYPDDAKGDGWQPLPHWQQCLIGAVFYLVTLALLYLVIALAAFEWRNPKANSVTTLRHIGDALSWQRIPEFQ